MQGALNLGAGALPSANPSAFSPSRSMESLARYLRGYVQGKKLSAAAMVYCNFASGVCINGDRLDESQFYFARTIDMLASVTRASAAWSPNWTFRSGDPVGALEEVAANVLRYNQPPNTAGGRLIETAAATNRVRNPRGEGLVEGVTGSGGAWPTHWLAPGAATEVKGRGTEKGWPYVDIRFSGAALGYLYFFFGTTSYTAASVGQSWVSAVGMRVVGGSMANVDGIEVGMQFQTAAGAYISEHSATALPDATHRRYFHAATAPATTGYVVPQGRFINAAGACDVTIRFYLPQLELGTVPSSPVLPPEKVPGIATREAETLASGVTFTRASRGHASRWDGWASGGPVGPLVEFPAGAPRQGEWGLFIEPAVTNKFRNPRHIGAVAGTPGTAPTHHIISPGGANTTVVGRGTESGWDYVDVRWHGAATGNFYMRFELQSYITAADAQKWSFSVGMRLLEGSFANISSTRLRVDERTAAAAFVKTNLGDPVAIDRVHRRFAYRTQLTGGGTVARVDPSIEFTLTAPGNIDVTIRFYTPQMTQTAFTASPVLPEPGVVAEATRVAEICTLPVSLSAAARTLNFEGFTLSAAAGETNWIATLYRDGNNFGGYDVTGGLLYVDDYGGAYFTANNPSAIPIGQPTRAAYAYAANDMAFSRNGLAQVLDAAGSNTVDNAVLGLGCLNGAASNTAFCFTALRLFGVRLGNAELESVVANAA